MRIEAARSLFLQELAAAGVVAAVQEPLLDGWAALNPATVDGARQRLVRCKALAARFRLDGVQWFCGVLESSADFWLTAPARHPWNGQFVMAMTADMPGSAVVGTEDEAVEGFSRMVQTGGRPAGDMTGERLVFWDAAQTRWRAGHPAPSPPRRPSPPPREVGAKAFRALVVYHCLASTLDQVAADLGVSKGEASKLVHRAADALSIRLRPQHKPGRHPAN